MSRENTNHKAQGLVMDASDMEVPLFAVPQIWKVPSAINFDSYLLPPSNQYNDPACAGFAVAGYAEFVKWRKRDAYEQIDGLEVYEEAKQIDGYSGPGTYLRFALQAAQSLGHIPQEWQSERLSNKAEVQYAMHRYGIAIAGFNITTGWNHADSETGAIDESMTNVLGGHAVLISSYDEHHLRGPNSWGMEWGDKGYWQMSWNAFDRQFMTGIVVKSQEV